MMKLDPIQLNNLQRDFRRLTVQNRARKLVSSLKDAAKPMRDEARNRTPVLTGVTRKSINWKKLVKGNFFGIRLHGDYKLNFLEKGTVPRRKKGGGFTGSGPAFNIQSGAFDKTIGKVTERFANSLRRKIDLALRR